jgi:outer membrane protein OmpA-like peptidoglycan-associated protein
MKTKFITLALVSAALFACGGKKGDSTAKKDAKNVVASMSKKKYDSVKTLSDASFVPDRVFFNFDEAKLQDEYQGDLKVQAAYLKAKLLENPKAQIVIEGNCDERGGVDYNMSLGLKRANAAKKFLVSEGISAKSIKVTSFGKERKLVDGVDAVAYLQNRAAVTKISN